jgi:hypothetical protein
VDPVSGPLLLRISVRAENRTRDLWTGSQKLLQLDGSYILYTCVNFSVVKTPDDGRLRPKHVVRGRRKGENTSSCVDD